MRDIDAIVDATYAKHPCLACGHRCRPAEALAEIGALMPRHKIEWLIHTLDLIDKLAASRGMDTSTEAQDDLRKLADLLDGADA